MENKNEEIVKDNENLEKSVDNKVDIENNETEIDEEFESFIVETELNEQDSKEIRIRDINLRIQELEVKMDKFEFEHSDIDKVSDEELAQFVAMRNEYNSLIKEKKLIKREKKKQASDSSIDNASPFVFLYGIFIDIFTFPLIAYGLYFSFASWIIEKFVKGSINSTGFFYKLFIWLTIFSLPILLFALSWFIYSVIIKKKINKKIHLVFWIIQGLSTLATIIWLTISVGIFK